MSFLDFIDAKLVNSTKLVPRCKDIITLLQPSCIINFVIMRYFSGHLLTVCLSLLFFLTLPSCSKEEKIPLSDECSLFGFSLNRNDNPGLTNLVNGVLVNDLIYVTVPDGVDLKSLALSFNVSPGATVTCDGHDATVGKHDLSNIATLKITSESGIKSSTYKILARNGNAKVDNLVYDFMKTYSIPGVAVDVMKDEDIIYAAGYGFAVKENQTRVTPNHLFRLASISKQFTTLCIMKLYEDGLLDLDDYVFGENGILKDQFPGVTGLKALITVKNFLQHNSGFPTSPDPMFSSIRDGKDLDGLIEYILNQDLVNSPGTKYAYYNMGFGVLGKIVEVVSGMGFEEYLKTEVLAPMGVKDIHVGGDQNARKANECVYYMQNDTHGYDNPMYVIRSAGGIIASANELMEVLRHIDGRDGVEDTFKKSTLDLMYNTIAPCYDRYALGWRVGHSLFPGGHYHSGNLAGTSTFWVGNSDGNMSGCVLCNSRSYITNPDFDSAYYILMSEILKILK